MFLVISPSSACRFIGACNGLDSSCSSLLLASTCNELQPSGLLFMGFCCGDGFMAITAACSLHVLNVGTESLAVPCCCGMPVGNALALECLLALIKLPILPWLYHTTCVLETKAHPFCSGVPCLYRRRGRCLSSLTVSCVSCNRHLPPNPAGTHLHLPPLHHRLAEVPGR